MTNGAAKRRNVSSIDVFRGALLGGIRDKMKSYRKLRSNVSAVASDRMPARVFLTKLLIQLVTGFVKNTVFSIAFCYVMEIPMILAVVYVMVRTFLTVFSVSRMFMDEMVGIGRK